MVEQERGPQSFVEFIGMIIKAYISGIPSVIKGMIVSVIVSAVMSNAIHFYLIGWVNDGWNDGGNPWLDPMLFLTSQPNSPKVMLAYFMITYLFWWVIGMFRSKGIGETIKMIATSPIWIIKSLTSIGFAVLPRLMGGLAVSFVLGLTVLTKVTSITMFLMMLTVLISQEESLIIMGLQLGFKDVSGLVNRNQQPQIPSAHIPSAAITGACIGFGYMAFFNTNPMVIGGIALLSIAGLVYMFMQSRKGPQTAVICTLIVVISAVAIMAPVAFADDGGIPENGGWGSLASNPWLINQLISKGYPASIAASLAAAIISGMFSPPVLSKIKPLGDGYVQKDWKSWTKDGKVDIDTRFKEDPQGQWETPDGKKWSPESQEGVGLTKTIIDAEDSKLLGDKVRIFTQEPPKDQKLITDITDGIKDLGRDNVDNLHPDNWKNLTPDEKGKVMEKISDVLKDKLGLDYKLDLYSNEQKPGLGGSWSRGTKGDPNDPNVLKINTSGNAFKDPREAIRTLIHETRHGYQEKVQDPNGTDYEQMCEYNDTNYVRSGSDYVRYNEQYVERDSRNFGHNTTNQLIGELNKMWSGE